MASKTVKKATPATETSVKSKKSASKTKSAVVTTAKASTPAPRKKTTAVKPAVAATSKPSAETNRFKVNFGQSSQPSQLEHLTEEQLRKIKSGLNKKDLLAFRELLMQKRHEIMGDVESLKADAKNIGANISYEHMADTGSDNYEQEFTLGLVESERQMLHEINDALIRIDKGIYGVCMVTGKPIDRARLEAKPWAKYCIEIAREKERHLAPRFRA